MDTIKMNKDEINKNIIDDFDSCKICHCDAEEESLLSPCKCRGSLKYIHKSCLFSWLGNTKNSMCEICKYVIKIRNIYASDTPTSIPLFMLIYHVLTLIGKQLMSLSYLLIFIGKVFIIAYLNAKTVDDGCAFTKLFFAHLILNFGYMNYLLLYKFASVAKKIERESLNLDTNYYMVDGVENDDMVDNSNLNDNIDTHPLVNERTSSTGDEYFTVDEFKRFYYSPFELMNNIKVFIATCGLSLIILTFSEFIHPLFIGIIQKAVIPLMGNYKLQFSHPSLEWATEFILGYHQYLKNVNIAVPFFKLFTFFILYTVFLFVVYLIKCSVTNFKVNTLYLYLKSYYFISVISLFLCLINSSVLIYVWLIRWNSVEVVDTIGGIGGLPSFAIFIHLSFGFILFNIFRTYSHKFFSQFRPGIFTFDVNDEDSRIYSVVRNTMVSPFFYFLSSLFFYLIQVHLSSLFLVSHITVYSPVSFVDKYIVLMHIITISKNRQLWERQLFKVFSFIYRTLSKILSLSNYLYGDKVTNVGFDRIYWDSNVNDGILRLTDRASLYSSTNIDTTTMIEDYLDYLNNVGIENTVASVQCPSILNDSIYRNSTLTEVPSKGEANIKESGVCASSEGTLTKIQFNYRKKYQINNVKFVKYFGRKHKGSLSLFYQPTFTWLRVKFISLICLFVTKAIFMLSDKIIHEISHFMKSFILSSELISFENFYYLNLSIIVSIPSIFNRNFLVNIAVDFYAMILSPAITSTTVYLFTSFISPFTTIFYVSSVFHTVVCSVFLALFSGVGNFLFQNSFAVIFTFSLVSNATIIFVFNHTWINFRYILLAGIIIILVKKFSDFLISILTGKLVAEVREKYYLKDRLVLDYSVDSE